MAIGPITSVVQAAQGITQAAGTGAAGGGGFQSALNGALGHLAQSTSQANALAAQFATGSGGDIGSVMVATAQADLAVESVSTVVSKALSAYQSIMQMSV
jgi:flagellar hook-basal body complex protein FliE